MALSTYSELKTSIANWLIRDDLTSVIPDFITLAEAAHRRDVRHWDMENRATTTLSQRYLERPSGWLETIRVTLQDNGTKALNLISRQDMAEMREGASDATGTPRFFCHVENSYEFYPTPDGSYTIQLHYYEQPTPLSDSSPSNWLLTDHPDVYLYGALLHAGPYLVEDERVGVWAQLYSAALSRLNASNDSSIYSGSGLQLKVRGLG